MFEIQEKQKFKNIFSNKFTSNFSEANKDRVPSRKTYGGTGGDLQSKKSNCAKCGKKHMGKCLMGTDNHF